MCYSVSIFLQSPFSTSSISPSSLSLQYIIMRDPNRAIVRVYGVPVGTFEDSDGSDDEDGSGSGNEGEDDGPGGDEEE